MPLAGNDQELRAGAGNEARTTEQKRADHALKTIRALKNLDHGQGSDNKSPPIYGNLRAYVENLPTTIVMSGLGQAMATELAAARMGEDDSSIGRCELSEMIKFLQVPARGKRSSDERAHELLFCIVQDWLWEERVYSRDQDLMEAIVRGDQKKYVRAQAEALAYLEWLKKFSQAFLRKGGKDER